MASPDLTERPVRGVTHGTAARTHVDGETKLSLKTTEFWAMVGVIAAILVASAISDSLGDVRAWTLVAAVAIGYMVSRGLAKSGSRSRGDEPTR